MKHNKYPLSFLLACFATAASLAGCTWDSSLYDDFVNKNTDSVMKCEGRLGITLPNGVYAYQDRTNPNIYYFGTYDDVGKDSNRLDDITCDPENIDECNNLINNKLGFSSYEEFKDYFKRMTRIPAEGSQPLCPYNTESCGPLMVRISGQNGSLPSLEPITFCNECKEHSVKCRVGEKIDCIDIRSNQHCGSCDNDCTKTNQICKLEGNNYKCVAPDCPLGQHYGENGCEDDTINACGSKNEDCTKKYNALGWKNENSGYCGIIIENTNTSESLTCTKEQSNNIRECVKEITSDPNYDVNEKEEEIKKCFLKYYPSGTTMVAACLATDCLSTHHLEGGKCVPNFGCETTDEYYYNGECKPNTLKNCGKHNNNCSDITGWSNECADDTYDVPNNTCGACIEGICVPSICQKGYHLDKDNNGKDICVADDSNNCGGVGDKDNKYKCGQGQVCTGGKCSDNCGSGEVRCEKDGNVSCADPDTSTTFCGADDTCSTYITCAPGQACIGGECKQNSCTEDNETLCVVNGENVCINVNNNDANHCGACNLKCSDRPMANASSTTCSNGQCQYGCTPGYENCGTSTVPNCIDEANFQNDPNNCGGCGKRCNSDELCSNGTCKKSTCTNQCLVNGACVNKNDACGVQCTNCNSANFATSGTCSASGTCTITACIAGYHLTAEETCAQNTETACGSPNGTDVVNCVDKDSTHATEAYCNADAQCVATSCETRYHVVEGVCVEDTETACGASATNCTNLEGLSTDNNAVECKDGKCNAKACRQDYHLAGADGEKKCIRDSETACGENSKNCENISYATRAYCDNGMCYVVECTDGYKPNNKNNQHGTCQCDNTLCNQIPTGSHIKTRSCQDNECVITSCETHYKKTYDNTACVCDSDSCTKTNIKNATAAQCSDNECKITCLSNHPNLNPEKNACECTSTSCTAPNNTCEDGTCCRNTSDTTNTRPNCCSGYTCQQNSSDNPTQYKCVKNNTVDASWPKCPEV